ncbi:MAG: efflux transporter outer membrane subunit [Betaproteobacteria bacterium]|nr:efflux transporter outer membrane subunit [Betaproteobacteria bacterium]
MRARRSATNTKRAGALVPPFGLSLSKPPLSLSKGPVLPPALRQAQRERGLELARDAALTPALRQAQRERGPSIALVITAAIAVALALTACAPLPPQPAAPQPRTPARLGLAEHTATPRPAEQWWRGFGDAALDAWVERALAGQPSLAAAAARTARAGAAVSAERAAGRPQLDLEADVGTQRYSEHGLIPPAVAGQVRDSATVQLAGRWEIDFFGRHRTALAAALGHERALAAEQQAARTLLAAEVVRAWVRLARLHDERTLAERALALRETMLALTRQREAAGLDSRLELRQAESALPDARRQIEALDEQMTRARHALAALAGEAPGSMAATFAWPAPSSPAASTPSSAQSSLTPSTAPRLAPLQSPPLPTPLGADLLGRRADVVAARWRVEAATHGVALARAQYLPDFDLVAFAGFNSLGLSRLLDLGSRNLGARAALRLPVFDGGRLDAQLGARHADLAAAVAAYDGAVIGAVREAADAAASVRSLQRQRAEHEQTLAAAEAALAFAAERQRAGIGGALPVLTIELQVLQQRRAAAELHARSLDAQAQLMGALGGGYEEPPAARRGSE